jgi:hypothetical protein
MKFITSLFAVMVLALAQPVYGAINTNIYSGFTENGGGAPFSGLVGSFTTYDVLFYSNYTGSWHPFDLPNFGADITGMINADIDGIFRFELFSDDGSLLFIDGNLVVDNGTPHGPQSVAKDVSLTMGLHSFEIQFFEDRGDPSGVDLKLPEGITYPSSVPEPTTIVIWSLLGVLGMFYGWRKRKA